MILTQSLLKTAASYVAGYMTRHLSKDYVYHNLSHTQSVVESASQICGKESLPNDETLVVLVAAWFHDLGYTQQSTDHEQLGAFLAEEFLLNEGIDQRIINQVVACILATRYPQKPANHLEKILCDADMAHLGAKGFGLVAESLRQEWANTRKRNYSDREWYRLNIDFLESHTFHTAYGREKFEKRKQKNIKHLRKSLQESTGESGFEAAPPANIVKGVETLFKNASRNHMELSAMADNKAHILLSISSLIVSVVLSVSVQHLGEETQFILPTAVLLVVCLTTMVMAVLTTRPKITNGVSTIEQIKARKANLLFFGNFHRMDLSTYEWGLRELIQDKDYMYTTMTRDIYFLGKVLATKYRLLSIGYRVFMYGLIVSVIAFTIAVLIKNAA